MEMNSRERVLAAIRHEETDRVPVDIGGCATTNISLPAYGNLKRYLNLTEGKARVFHTWSQIPEVETVIADRLHSDTVTLPRYKTSFGIPNKEFKHWTFVDGTEYLVPADFNPIQNEKGDYEWLEQGAVVSIAPGSWAHGFLLKQQPLKL